MVWPVIVGDCWFVIVGIVNWMCCCWLLLLLNLLMLVSWWPVEVTFGVVVDDIWFVLLLVLIAPIWGGCCWLLATHSGAIVPAFIVGVLWPGSELLLWAQWLVVDYICCYLVVDIVICCVVVVCSLIVIVLIVIVIVVCWPLGVDFVVDLIPIVVTLLMLIPFCCYIPLYIVLVLHCWFIVDRQLLHCYWSNWPFLTPCW